MDTMQSLLSRVSVPPKLLGDPAPSGADLDEIMAAAMSAPDHGALMPWRFITIEGEARAKLGEVFVDALMKRDPGADQRAISQVYLPEDVYSATDPEVAPDLIVGCAPGYRISSPSCGHLVMAPLIDNTDKWSGDHTIAADFVPGLVVGTHPIQAQNPGLVDIPATVIAHFGATPPPQMKGVARSKLFSSPSM